MTVEQIKTPEIQAVGSALIVRSGDTTTTIKFTQPSELRDFIQETLKICDHLPLPHGYYGTTMDYYGLKLKEETISEEQENQQ